MEKIAIGNQIFSIVGVGVISRSETVKGNMQSMYDPKFQDTEWTVIEYAYDSETVGVTIIESPLSDVEEHFEMMENDGKIVAFDVPIFLKALTTPEEKAVLEHVLSAQSVKTPPMRLTR